MIRRSIAAVHGYCGIRVNRITTARRLWFLTRARKDGKGGYDELVMTCPLCVYSPHMCVSMAYLKGGGGDISVAFLLTYIINMFMVVFYFYNSISG